MTEIVELIRFAGDTFPFFDTVTSGTALVLVSKTSGVTVNVVIPSGGRVDVVVPSGVAVDVAVPSCGRVDVVLVAI